MIFQNNVRSAGLREKAADFGRGEVGDGKGDEGFGLTRIAEIDHAAFAREKVGDLGPTRDWPAGLEPLAKFDQRGIGGVDRKNENGNRVGLFGDAGEYRIQRLLAKRERNGRIQLFGSQNRFAAFAFEHLDDFSKRGAVDIDVDQPAAAGSVGSKPGSHPQRDNDSPKDQLLRHASHSHETPGGRI